MPLRCLNWVDEQSFFSPSLIKKGPDLKGASSKNTSHYARKRMSFQIKDPFCHNDGKYKSIWWSFIKKPHHLYHFNFDIQSTIYPVGCDWKSSASWNYCKIDCCTMFFSVTLAGTMPKLRNPFILVAFQPSLRRFDHRWGVELIWWVSHSETVMFDFV